MLQLFSAEIGFTIKYMWRTKKKKQMDQFNIFLIGFMGTGKTTIANCLSRKLDRKVVEMDQIISERAGMSISDIFKTYGEQHFRDLETGLLVETQSCMPVIVSCVGGTPMRECNVAEMKKSGCTVLLTACPETILQRTKDDHDRPLLEKNKSIEFIAELMEKRREKYEAAADIIIETDGKNKKEICEELVRKVIAWFERR